MKTTFTLSLILLIQSAYAQEAMDFKKLEWLMGTWNQTNVSKPGRTSHERWSMDDLNKLSGYAVTMQGADTLFIEKTTILIKDNVLYYVADVPGNKEAIYFKFIELTNNGFVCENPQHDFPKKISYQLNGNTLKAQISGNGKTIDYYFERKL